MVSTGRGLYTGCTVISVNLYIGDGGLTIGALSKRTGLGVSTLRAWERRHGFPVPFRTPSGHRRYRPADVDVLLDVLRARRDGSTLESALARARRRTDGPRSSTFAALRDALPDVVPHAMTKRTMHGISRAIEDEATDRADDGVFIGAFQAARFWRATFPRWRDIAARADVVVALAAMRRGGHRGKLWEIPIPSSSPMAREWAVICDSPTFSACLVGVEQPGQDGVEDHRRVFDGIWTVEPAAVRAAAITAVEVGATSAPAIAELLDARLRQAPVASYDSIRSATRLTNRIVAYVGR